MYRWIAPLILIALVFALATTGCYMFRSADDYYGLELQEAQDRVLFVVDVSGSMEGKAEGETPQGRLSTRATDEAISLGTRATTDRLSGRAGRKLGSAAEDRAREETTKLGAAKRELLPMIRGLEEHVHFNILLFGHEISEWEGQMVPATEESRSDARSFVRDLSARGGTPALGVLERAFEDEVDVIFFVSDGIPTDARPQRILDEVSEWNRERGIVIHTIGLGDDMDEVFMDRLAEQNGGEFVYF